jgi:hypothetical protein
MMMNKCEWMDISGWMFMDKCRWMESNGWRQMDGIGDNNEWRMVDNN